jgi:hypothetical protein
MLKLLNTKIRFVWVSLLFLFLSQFALADICHFSGFGGVDLGYPYSDSVSDQPQSGFSSPAQACDFLVPRTAYQQANPGGFTETGYLTITEVRLGEKYYPIKFSQPEYYQYNFYCFGTLSRRYSPPILVDSDVTGFRAGGSCSCGTVTQACHNTALILSLTPAPNQKDPRPLKAEGKDGKSTLELIAKVTENGSPKAGVTVGFGVASEPFSGGHVHGDLGSIPRPKGTLSKTSGITDANGEIKLTFIADEPAGLHAVVADCAPAGCTNTATHVVKVKVPDLIHIPPDFGNAPARYVLIGNYKTPENPAQQINHNDTHFLTERSWANLDDLINTFIRLGWGQVGINDASLEWGGMFDIEGRWLDPVLRPNGKFTTGGHAEHRDGQQVDISFVRPASASEALRKKVYDEACSAKEAELPRILWHKNDGYAPHFHIYLTGKGVTGAKKQCGVS